MKQTHTTATRTASPVAIGTAMATRRLENACVDGKAIVSICNAMQ